MNYFNGFIPDRDRKSLAKTSQSVFHVLSQISRHYPFQYRLVVIWKTNSWVTSHFLVTHIFNSVQQYAIMYKQASVANESVLDNVANLTDTLLGGRLYVIKSVFMTTAVCRSWTKRGLFQKIFFCTVFIILSCSIGQKWPK